ncbi:hypothetical protein AMS68_000006 [Peltaster fructicola]|uniref:Uncharacterized protein n=1 Tax=Peltaster fructicola TaxID=286661 RepID=A0A6H0XIM8_9PEZI|nr:hypothetical protein AMS68_000006 [Peltaster fructicola]
MALVLLSCFPLLVSGLNVFHSNCTIPDSNVHFASAPNTRGTLEIVWTSLATIIACVFTVLHLNVPEQRQGRDPGWKGDLYWTMKNLRTSLSYSLLTISIPELMLGKSITDRRAAQYYLKELHESMPETKTTWTLQHMLYAGMGGFVAVYGAEVPPMPLLAATEEGRSGYTQASNEAASQPGVSYSNDQTMSTTRDLESNMRLGHGDARQSAQPSRLWHFTCGSLVYAIKKGLVSNVPPLTSAEVMDKSKADLVSKIVAIFQICYFVIVVIARAGQRLPVSQLELGACAFVPYAIAIYLFSHDKVKSARVVAEVGRISAQSATELSRSGHYLYSVFLYGYKEVDGSCVSNSDYEDSDNTSYGFGLYIPVLASIPFGSIHIAAWNFDFSSQVDAQSWRIASIVITLALPYLVMTTVVVAALPWDS